MNKLKLQPISDRVTIVLLTYNCADRIATTVRHLIDSQVPIIAVDNASEDDTLDVLRGFKQLQVIALPKNIGAAGRNYGVEAAKTPYVAFADDDAWWDPASLTTAANLLEAHPRLVLVNARILVGPEKRLDPICEEMAMSPWENESGIPGKVLVSFMAGASVVKRQAYLQAGGYDKKFFMGGEEETLAWKMLKLGWQMRYIPDVIAYHHPSKQNAGGLRHYGIRNTIWTAWLHRPASSAWRWTLYVIKSSPKNFLLGKALLMAFAGAPWVWRHRQVVERAIEHKLATLDTQKMTGKSARQYGKSEA